MIYSGKCIFKEEHPDYEKGDVQYVPYTELEELISDISFLLSDVVSWTKYKTKVAPFNNKEEKVSVKFKYAPNSTIIESYKAFTEMMIDYDASRFIQFREQ